MTDPLTLACPTCGARLELTPAQREDRTFSAACDGGKRHRLVVMRVVDDVAGVEA